MPDLRQAKPASPPRTDSRRDLRRDQFINMTLRSLIVKKILQIGVLALGLTLGIVAATAAPQAYKLRVDGLSCPFCAYGIEKKLGAVKGVQRIEVDIASGTVVVIMAEGAILDEASANKAVKEAGFSLRGLEQAPAAPQSTSGGQTK